MEKLNSQNFRSGFEPGRHTELLPEHPIPGKGAALNPGRVQSCRELLRPGELKSKPNGGAEVLKIKGSHTG